MTALTALTGDCPTASAVPLPPGRPRFVGPSGDGRLPVRPIDPLALPEIGPGQLWLIELAVENSAPPKLAHHALASANVVIYDRVLAAMVAALLPRGGYAEPAPEDPQGPGAERCVHFVRDGWSVVRLLRAPATLEMRAERVRDVVQHLGAAKAPGNLPVSVLAASDDGACEKTDARLRDLAASIAAHRLDKRLTIVIGAIGSSAGPRLYAVAANGLAG